MATCPLCNTRVEHLVNKLPSGLSYEMDLIEGEASYDRERDCTPQKEAYFCPVCDVALFTHEPLAVIFLRGDA